MTNGLQQILDVLQSNSIHLSDAQLLAQFLTTRDESSFATLVRRHGPMVIGVCRRILRDEHDAEDAFQAAFLILAQKAASVVKRESLSCWLYQVAYHAALEASASRARRRARERPVNDVPHPETPVDVHDWRPLLDRELNALPEKYRSAILLCDLEGRTRKEAAKQLRIPEGTLSSRLATAHKMLAKRLTRSGLTLSGGALAAAIIEGMASAQVPASLVGSTAAAALSFAHQLTAASTPAVLLMRGVLKAMLLSKLKRAVGAMMILAALGAMGLGYSTGGNSAVAQSGTTSKPLSELESLRKENELLRLNLQVVLEKVRAQETELSTMRNQNHSRRDSNVPGGGTPTQPGMAPSGNFIGRGNLTPLPKGIPADAAFPTGREGTGSGGGMGTRIPPVSQISRGGIGSPAPTDNTVTDPYAEVEDALRVMRESRDKDKLRQAAQQLDRALTRLKDRIK